MSNEDGFIPLHMDNVKNQHIYSIRLNEDILEFFKSSNNNEITPSIKFSNGEMVLSIPDQPDIIGTVVSEEKPHFYYVKDEEYGYVGLGTVKNKIVIKSSFKKKEIPSIQYDKLSKNIKPTEVIQSVSKLNDKTSKKIIRSRDGCDVEQKKKKMKTNDEEDLIEPLEDVIIDEELLNKAKLNMKTYNDWKKGVEIYKKLYPSYRKLFIQLERHRNQLIRLKSSQGSKSQSKSKKIINERNEMIREMYERYNLAHKKLSELKSAIDTFYERRYCS